MTRFNNVTVKASFLQAMQLNSDNIPEFEAFVNGSQKGTMLPRGDREVEFWDKYVAGGQEQRVKMDEWAVKWPNSYIHVVTTLLFSELYRP